MACQAGRWEDDKGMDPSKTMACPECGNVVAVTDQFCSKCYSRLERPTFWRRLGSWFRSALKPGPHTLFLKRNESFKIISQEGERKVYHSLDEVPPEYREDLKKLQAEAAKSPQGVSTSRIVVHKKVAEIKFQDASGKEEVYHSLEEMPPEWRALVESELTKSGLEDRPAPGVVVQKVIREEFKFKDAWGKEHVYHSLEEMPPEQRALFEKVQGRLDLPGQKTEG
jgi:hypothetical protein